MTTEETKKAIEVMQAYVDGNEIENKRADSQWVEDLDPTWSWLFREYRIKPTEKRMTKIQLCEWLAKGFGYFVDEEGIINPSLTIDEDDTDGDIGFVKYLCHWGKYEQLEPTEELYQEDCL